MSTMLMELMHHLQDVHTHYPNDDGHVIVAVPTTPHVVERFEVEVVHNDGPSVVLRCQPLQDEKARLQDEQATPPAKMTQRPDTQLRMWPFWPVIFSFLDASRLVANLPARQVEKTKACVHNDYEDLA